MVRLVFVLYASVLVIVTESFAQVGNDSVFNAVQIQKLIAEKGSSYRAKVSEDKELSLFIFLSPECPLCKNYSSLLNQLHNRYGGKVSFYGIIPGAAYSEKRITTFKKEYAITFPLVSDRQFALTHYLQADITPQAILLDKKAELVYKGAIDNLLPALGKKRLFATAHYLDDALKSAIQKEIVAIKRTKAVGCSINNY